MNTEQMRNKAEYKSIMSKIDSLNTIATSDLGEAITKAKRISDAKEQCRLRKENRSKAAKPKAVVNHAAAFGGDEQSQKLSCNAERLEVEIES